MDKEMLANLDLLMNYEVLIEEDNWQEIESIDDENPDEETSKEAVETLESENE